MEGRGVVSYDNDRNKTSYGISMATTEFDDELLKRKIVTKEQVLMAKGATPQQAQEMVQQEKEHKKMQQDKNSIAVQTANDENESDDVDDEYNYLLDEDISNDNNYENESDKAFFDRYRQERIAQLKQEQQQKQQQQSLLNVPKHIVRSDWTEYVTEASQQQNTWVVVVLVDEHPQRRDAIMQLISRIRQSLANENKYETLLQWVTILFTDAIPNWPSHRVPTMFAYQGGIKQHEWITQQNIIPNVDQLLYLLKKEWKIIF